MKISSISKMMSTYDKFHQSVKDDPIYLKNISDFSALDNGKYYIKYSNGDLFKGDFQDNNMNGSVLQNGMLRIGTFLLCKNEYLLHGESGIIQYPSGAVYMGPVNNDRIYPSPPINYKIPANLEITYRGFTGILIKNSIDFIVTFDSAPFTKITSSTFNFYSSTFYKYAKLVIHFKDNSVFTGSPNENNNPTNKYVVGDKDYFRWGHFQSYCWLLGNFHHFSTKFFDYIKENKLTIRQIKECYDELEFLNKIEKTQLIDLIKHFQYNGCN